MSFLKQIKVIKVGLVAAFFFSSIANAQVDEACWTKIRQAETDYTAYPYTECQFDAGKTALTTWGTLAMSQGYKRALYELCRRYARYAQGKEMCIEASRLGEKAALAQLGVEALNKGEIKQANSLFEQIIPVYAPADNPVVAEQIGLYYLKALGDKEKARPYLKAAADNRSALANNILGVLTLSEAEAEKDPKKLESITQSAFESFWRSILLDCPMAEENLGVLELWRGQQITGEQTMFEMKKRLFSCVHAQNAGEVDFDTCDCTFVLKQLRQKQNDPFEVLSTVPGVSAKIRDKMGKTRIVKKGDLFLSGKIKDILQGAVAYQGFELVLIPIYQASGCEDYCQLHPDQTAKREKGQYVEIRPYRLRFNRKECEDIFYYAPRLVDVQLPFVGKTECVKYR